MKSVDMTFNWNVKLPTTTHTRSPRIKQNEDREEEEHGAGK